jgi:hypothetical protein
VRSPAAAALVAIACSFGCHTREAPEAAMARALADSRRTQIANLERLIAEAEKGELVTTDQLAIGVSEELLGNLLRASLPSHIVVAERIRLEFLSVEPVFRGGLAGVMFKAKVSSADAPNASATLSIGGGLDEFRFEGGKLAAWVKLKYFNVVEATGGDLGANILDGLVRANLETIQSAIPSIEVPIQLEQTIRIGGLTEGAVVAKPGSLPLAISVSQVLPINNRLWVLLSAKAGPWQAATEAKDDAKAASDAKATPDPKATPGAKATPATKPKPEGAK